MNKLSYTQKNLTNKIKQFQEKGLDTKELENNLKKIKEQGAEQLKDMKGKIGDMTQNIAQNLQKSEGFQRFQEKFGNTISKKIPTNISMKIPPIDIKGLKGLKGLVR